MHFVTGGAFNGKRAWVKKTYPDACWLSAYENVPMPSLLNDIDKNLLVLEGIEIWLKELSDQNDANQSREIWKHHLEAWGDWEKANTKRQLVVIGTDITKGIVPMGKDNRLWRDVTGWAFQDLAAKAEKVDLIWYGIDQTLKPGGDM